MQKTLILVAGIYFIRTLLSAQAFKVVEDNRTTTTRSSIVIGLVDSLSLKKHSVSALGNSRIRVGKLAIYQTSSEMYRATSQGGTDCTYEAWLDRVTKRGLKANASRCPVVGYAIKIGSQIVLRLNDENCRITSLGAKSQRSVNIIVDGFRAEVVDLTIYTANGFTSQPHIIVYLHTNATLTLGLARRFLTKLQELTHQPMLSVVVRNDKWFITDCDFPMLSSFVGVKEPIPERDAHLNTKQVYCGLQQPWPIQCY